MRKSTVFIPLLLLVACSASEDSGPHLTGETMHVVEVVRDFTANPTEWEVVRARSDQEPFVDVVCPALRHGLDGADMLSMILPPPAEIRFRLDSEGQPGVLRMRTGVDISTLQMLSKANPEGTFLFDVLVDGESVHHGEIVLRYDREHPGSEWADVGGAEGVAVKPGSEITLRTGVLDPLGNEVETPKPVLAGFGGVRLERTRELPRTASSRRDPNLVLIVMDTLRADRLEPYGWGRPTSPHLKTLAERGTVFEEAYSTASWTWPSTASLMTGLHPEEHGVHDSGSCFLAPELTTVAEAVQSVGLTTAGWSSNPLITASRNFDQGFESFDDEIEDFRKAGEFFGDIEHWVESRADTRFFLYLQFTEPHRPYRPLPEGRDLLAPGLSAEATARAERAGTKLGVVKAFAPDGTSLLDELTTKKERDEVSRLYDAGVWSGDHWLGETLALFDRLGLTEKTVFVFTADHGEELFERNHLGHSTSVYRELVHVPLVLAGPGVPEGLRLQGPVSNRLVAPFLASVPGARLGVEFDPEDFFDPAATERRVIYSTELGAWNGRTGLRVRGMRAGRFSVQFAPEGGPWGGAVAKSDGDVRLFDLDSDPGERDDLGKEQPEELARLRAVLEARFDALHPAVRSVEHGTGAGTAAMLERIGYTGE